MHVYIYGSYVNEKKHEGTIARVETRITDLGLNGRIVRLGIMHSLYDAIENEIKKGAKTIIIVGNFSLLSQAVNSLAVLSLSSLTHKNIPLGFIPVGKKNNDIADILGLGYGEKACDALSARRIQTLDLGRANEYYFLSQAQITTGHTTLEIDESYSVEIRKRGTIQVINLPADHALPSEVKSRADDEVMELIIQSQKDKKLLPWGPGDQSIFSFAKLKILNPKFPVRLDNSIEVPTPVDITIAKEKINLIVGKERKF